MLTERALIGASHALTQARYGKGHAGYLLQSSSEADILSAVQACNNATLAR